MSISTNMHSEKGFTARSRQRGTTFWVTIIDNEGSEQNDVTFFFNDAVAAARVAAAFNHRDTENGESE